MTVTQPNVLLMI